MESSELADWYENVQSFTHYGQNLSYLDNGRDADVLVLLHGFPNSSWDWHEIWPVLGQKYRLITLDFLGYGRSDKPVDYDYSVMDQTDQVFRLLSHLGIRRVSLMGHSSGISVCQELLALVEIEHDPDLPEITSICFLNGSISPARAPTIMEQRLIQGLGGSEVQALNEEFLRKVMLTLAGSGRSLPEHEPGIHFEQLSDNNGLQVVSQLLHYVDERTMHGKRWQAAMCSTEIPLCAIIGADDPVWGGRLKEETAVDFPFLDVHYVEAAGHYIYLQAPDQLCRLWMSFHAKACISADNTLKVLGYE